MTQNGYRESVAAAAGLLEEADFVLIGAGAGLSAAAGLNYQDADLFARWYPQFYNLGIRSIWEGITTHWAPNDKNRKRFWAFWAHHIQRIRYDAPAGLVYLNLRHLVAKKEHFVISTNVDGQFQKAGFDPQLLFTPQGDYGQFQCDQPCCDALFDNRSRVEQMNVHLDPHELKVREEDIPRCPRCGSFLERNLRRDEHFLEAPHMKKRPAYEQFLNRSQDGKLVLLELGVGFNTPSIIRWPFERITARLSNASLIRMNLTDVEFPPAVAEKSIGFPTDCARVVEDVLESTFRRP
ncbi:MAG TPA: NAD-dependent protein deacetylase, SIR2 family [Methylomirabilota bacterium]|nr:NAD-dependent protein deacetylase, SIR2 family [Methylomirabilota bacterium]